MIATQNKEPEYFRETHSFRSFWQSFREDKIALISLYLFLALLVLVFGGAFIAPYHYEQQFVLSLIHI